MVQSHEWNAPHAAGPAAESSNDLLSALWRSKWSLLVILIVALGLGYLYFLKATPVFRSSAEVLLIKKEASIGGDSRRDRLSYGLEDALSTQMLLFSSPLIVGRAVEQFHLDALPSLKDQQPAAAAIIESLKTLRAGDKNTPDPNVMLLSYEGVNAEDCQTVLNALIHTYQQFLGETYQNANEEVMRLISQAKDVLHKQLTEKEAAYRKFRQESPLLWNNGSAANLHEQRLAEIEKSRSQAIIECAQLEGRIETLITAMKNGGNREALSLMVANMPNGRDKNVSRESVEGQIFGLLLRQQELMATYGPDHPQVRQIEKQIDMVREHFGKQPTADANNNDFLQVYVESLREELVMAQEKMSRYDRLFTQEQGAAKELASFQIQDETFRSEINRMKLMFDVVLKRLDEINLIKDYGGITADVICPPDPGYQVKPQLLKVMLAAAFLGLLTGIGVVYLRDMLDQRFRGPEEVSRQLGLPVMGHIPLIPAGTTEESPTNGDARQPVLNAALCTYHEPLGGPAEAYRAVRTSLYYSAEVAGQRVIQITSPGPGDGKTTLAANLAVAMAGSGKRVLLVDADFRRPRIDSYFGLTGGVGLSSVVAGNAEFSDAIYKTAVENVWVVPCGKRPSNPADLLASRRFKEFIDYQRELYDFVILDTPPVLAVTDPGVVAPRVDAVLLVIRLSKDSRKTATQAAETLKGLGARIVGVVINGIGSGKLYGGKYKYWGSQYYGGYRYGYRHVPYASYYGDPDVDGKGNEAESAAAARRNGTAVEPAAEPSPGEDQSEA
jgi:capsular exopolysaccharide synthesis family protein